MKTDQHFAVGLDLGGSSIKYGICNAAGKIIEEFKRPSQADESNKVILDLLAGAAAEAIEFAREQNIHVIAVGMGTPGSVNVEKGHLVGNTPNFRQWKNVPIKAELEKRLSLPVIADNDANVMAFGEARMGAGQGRENVVCITLGTGIGGGVIMAGKIFRGSNYAGAELGHMSISHDGIVCRCGGIGCWERYASASAMLDNYRGLNPGVNITSTVDIFERYTDNEVAAGTVVEQEIRMAATGVATLVNIFNPERVIIGGGVGEAGEWFIQRIAERVNKIAMKPALKGLEIVPATLGNQAGWLGAALLALETYAGEQDSGRIK